MSLLGPISTLGRWRDEVFNADFLAGQIVAGYTHTRASTATYWDSAGMLRVAAASEPRIAFDPLTRKCLGLHLEAAATNKLTYSDFQLPELVVAPATWVSEDWGRGLPRTGVRIKKEAVTSYAYRTSTRVTGETECFSAFVKMDNGGKPVIGPSGTAAVDMAIIMSGGALPVERTGVIDCGGGIYRVYGWHTYTSDNAASSCGLVKYSSNSARSFVVKGYQIESGSFPTSYVPAGSGTAARSADSGVFLAPWYDGGGTLMVEFERGPILPTGIATVAAIFDDGTNNNRAGIYLPNSADIAQFVTVVDGATVYSRSAAISGNAPTSIAAISFDGAGATSRINGVLPGSDVAVSSLPTGVTRLRTAAISRSFYLRSMRYYSGRRDLAVLTAR